MRQFTKASRRQKNHSFSVFKNASCCQKRKVYEIAESLIKRGPCDGVTYWRSDVIAKWCVEMTLVWRSDAMAKWCVKMTLVWRSDAMANWCVEMTLVWWSDAMAKWCVEMTLVWRSDAIAKWCVEMTLVWRCDAYSLPKWRFGTFYALLNQHG